jgi:hypothetical protein
MLIRASCWHWNWLIPAIGLARYSNFAWLNKVAKSTTGYLFTPAICLIHLTYPIKQHWSTEGFSIVGLALNLGPMNDVRWRLAGCRQDNLNFIRY